MPSTFTWLDASEADRRRALDVIDLFEHRNTRDELGIGSVRDALSDHFFPGTSTIQTRVRYFLFVPWIYQRLERRETPSAKVGAPARRHELRLADTLARSEDPESAIGAYAGQALQRLPSAIYWGGLGVWGIRLFDGSQEQYHRAFDRIHARRRAAGRRRRERRHGAPGRRGGRGPRAPRRARLPGPPGRRGRPRPARRHRVLEVRPVPPELHGRLQAEGGAAGRPRREGATRARRPAPGPRRPALLGGDRVLRAHRPAQRPAPLAPRVPGGGAGRLEAPVDPAGAPHLRARAGVPGRPEPGPHQAPALLRLDRRPQGRRHPHQLQGRAADLHPPRPRAREHRGCARAGDAAASLRRRRARPPARHAGPRPPLSELRPRPGRPGAWGHAAADRLPTAPEALEAVAGRLEPRLAQLLRDAPAEGAEDEAWYWAAPILLDHGEDPAAARDWLARDEAAHVLRDLGGFFDQDPADVALGIAAGMREALSLRTSNPEVDELRASRRSVHAERTILRSHFAMRFGAERTEDGQAVQRDDQVRQAFNSPFWPFVLASTSIGQEGLDFHAYCHAVFHWNLPTNPVDLEQREGRVHRFKGHAIRKNGAQHHGRGALGDMTQMAGGHGRVALAGGAGDLGSPGAEEPPRDPWRRAFERAEQAAASDHGLVPYWIYPAEDGAFIERRVPAYPLSRDELLHAALRRSLAAYRMVFGQPRQDDLMAYLLERLPREELERWAGEMRVDLGVRNEDGAPHRE